MASVSSQRLQNKLSEALGTHLEASGRLLSLEGLRPVLFGHMSGNDADIRKRHFLPLSAENGGGYVTRF